MAGLIVYIVESEKPTGNPTKDANLAKYLEDSLKLMQPLLIWSNDEYSSASKTLQDTYMKKIDDIQNTAKDISQLTDDLKSMFVMAEKTSKKK